MNTKLMAKVKEMRNRGMTWDQIGAEIGVSGALMWKVARGKCISHKALAYFSMAPIVVEPCFCGDVHIQKTCPHTRPKINVDRLSARVSPDVGARCRILLKNAGYKSVTDFWLCIENEQVDLPNLKELIQ